jgi:hypothetical protein
MNHFPPGLDYLIRAISNCFVATGAQSASTTLVVNLACDYLIEFEKKFKMAQLRLACCWWKMVIKQISGQIFRDTFPLNWVLISPVLHHILF